MSEIGSVINDLRIMANPTDEEMECLPEISGFEAEIILKEIENLHNIIKELELELSGYRQAILQDKEMLGLKSQLQQKENIIKEVREYIKQTGQYLEDKKRFKVDVLEPNYLDILEILDKENK